MKWRCGHTFTSIWAANTSSTSLNVPHARAPVTSQQSGSAAVNGSEARARRDHSPLLVINVNNVISRVTHVPGDDDGRRSSRGAEREPRFRCTAVIEIRGSFDATEQKGDEHTAQRIAPPASLLLRSPPFGLWTSVYPLRGESSVRDGIPSGATCRLSLTPLEVRSEAKRRLTNKRDPVGCRTGAAYTRSAPF